MSHDRSTPLVQIRITAPTDIAVQLLAQLTTDTRTLLGPASQYTGQIRAARRTGYRRAYLTVTTREDPS